ncbi:MAG: discoidin domain-containing protein [Opitutales bacterium]
MQESLSVPHRHDLTEYLNVGENTITVTVDNTIRFHLGGHSYAESTQTNWNGMTGDLELQATPAVYLEDVQAYPKASDRTVKVKVDVGNIQAQAEDIELIATVGETQVSAKLAAQAAGETTHTLNLTLPKDTLLWDDKTPNLHTLDVTLKSAKGNMARQMKIGLRDVSIQNKRIAINDIPVFLRGNVENCEFPLTGYPSSKVEDWRKMFLAFQDYGLNHVRFHSYTPPKAAFIAADELGIILQTELPFWGLTGVDAEKDAYLRRELDRILDEYGNHASMVMMCMGNELNVRGGDWDIVEEWVVHGKQKSPRHLLTGSTSKFKKSRSTDEFHISTRIRQLSDAGTNWDYLPDVIDFYGEELDHPPLISHELGQWCVYPDFREIDQYTGPLKARNFEGFRKALIDNHMGDQATDFTLASGKLSALLYRHEMEAVYRTQNTAGFQLLQLHDFPGQGTATVGILNVFREPKGVIEPADWQQSCAEGVALLRFDKRTYHSTETFEGTAEFIHFRKAAEHRLPSSWQILTPEGITLASGRFAPADAPIGTLVDLGKISVPLSIVKEPTPLTVRVQVENSISNESHIWVYPPVEPEAGAVVVHTEWNEQTKRDLNAGRKVLLLPKMQAGRGVEPAQFLPPFWSPTFKTKQSSTMGMLVDPEHPIFASFPTDFHTDWQWFDILERRELPQTKKWMWSGFDTYALVLDDLPAAYRPLVQPIDHFYRNKRLGLVVEGTYGAGQLLICTANLVEDTERRVAVNTFKQSILNYMNSADFQPSLELKDAYFDTWFDFAEEESKLRIKYVSSQHDGRHLHADKVIDGNLYTHWMNHNKGGVTYPHEIHFELDEPVVVKGFRYTPRQDLEKLGLIKDYEFYVTDHAFHWYSPVAKGSFAEGTKTQTIMLEKPKAGRNFRFVALSAMDGYRMATMAEFELITEPLTEFEYVP